MDQRSESPSAHSGPASVGLAVRPDDDGEPGAPDDRRFEFGVTPFYFLRHGETRESVRGIVQGQNDTRLNAKGRQSARKAAASLDGVTLRSIYASPLKRTWETARILSILTGVPVFPVPGLMERNWGPYQGRPKSMRPASPAEGSVESLEAFTARVVAAMDTIRGPSPVLVVAHSGVFRQLCSYTGLSDDPAVSVANDMVLRLEPPSERRPGWHISVVG